MVCSPAQLSRRSALALVLARAGSLLYGAAPERRWTPEAAQAWYRQQPWLVGSNYIPATAENQLEMWQAATFDPRRMELELGWAQGIGMNTMRVFLHDLLWEQDEPGFIARVGAFLEIAARHKIRPIFVLFDSCWDPNPRAGPQPPPRPGIHNSRWLQSPGAAALSDARQYPRLAAYVKGVLGTFASDSRVLAWDLWNEPFNVAYVSEYRDLDPANKVELVEGLLPQVFAWAREANPAQPLTCGLPRSPGPLVLSRREQMQMDLSDIISFHFYNDSRFRQTARWFQSFGRPVFCTEYLARSGGSTFQGTLTVAKELRVAAYNWGLVEGKTQTKYPPESWERSRFNRRAMPWFHDIFYADGSPYASPETALIRTLTGRR